jgi:hypothetical protein
MGLGAAASVSPNLVHYLSLNTWHNTVLEILLAITMKGSLKKIRHVAS